MRATYAVEPTPGRRTEDHIALGPSWAFVLDGATARPGIDSGCRHGVAWLVGELAAALAARLDHPWPLADVLADAIEATCAAHADTCDLTNPDSPSATVTVLRRRGARLEYLVLADSPLVLDVAGAVTAVVDDRTARLPSYTTAAVREARNAAGGFWVASTRPDAAEQALTGWVPAERVRRVALLSDGASRYVDRFGLDDWAGLLDLLEAQGPHELIKRVRAAERAETAAERRGRRGKRHDDASAVFLAA